MDVLNTDYIGNMRLRQVLYS